MNLELKNKLEQEYNDCVWEHMTLGGALDRWSHLYKDNIAVLDGGIELTYEALNDEVKYYAKGLLENGITTGDKVVLQMPNSVEFVIISFALFNIGAIPIMSLPAHRKTEIRGIIEASGAKAYIAKDKYLGFSYIDMIRTIMEEAQLDVNVFMIGNHEEYKPFGSLRSNGQMKEVIEIDHREIGLLLLSGGTTGIPKLIPRRHCDYLYVAKQCGKRSELNESSVYLAALPMAHNFPFGCPGVVGTFTFGGKVVICPTTSPDEIVPLIEEKQVTITGLVPAMANMCIEFLEMDEYDISSMKVLQVGGSVLDAVTAEKIEKGIGCKLQQIFGIAEGLICCTHLDDDDSIVYHTQGTPISEYDEVLIVDEIDKEVAEEEYGELIVRGPYTIYGYVSLEEINKSSITKDCYFRTGDKARKRKDGNYQVVGRLKEMINRAGEKIMPSEIEQILLTHERVSEVQVAGVPDEILGEKIGVFILEGHEELSLNEVRAFLKDKGVAHFKLPDLVKYVDSWPLTSVGKISKESLRNSIL